MIKLKYRILLDIFLLFIILHGWWFIALPLGILGLWKFNQYWEIILLGFIYDSLFNFNSELGVLSYTGSILTVLLYLILILLKKISR